MGIQCPNNGGGTGPAGWFRPNRHFCNDYSMNPRRRRWLAGAAAASGLAGAGAALAWPDEGVLNPCLAPDTDRWLAHPMVREALAGLDMAALWDCHAHLMPGRGGAATDAAGQAQAGDQGGPWPAPLMRIQEWFIAESACAGDRSHGPEPGAASSYLMALRARLQGLPPGCKLVLLAMDRYHDSEGRARPERTHFSVPDALCEQAVRRWPDRFEWAASVHPYRVDAVERIAEVVRRGALAVKWIPAAQGIDPASARCEPMYRELARHGLALITHAGQERATAGDDALGNPLRLRRALDAGVRVIVAHCATMGDAVDLDRGPNGPVVSSFSLFERLMDEPRHQTRLMGDLSAIGQLARAGPALATLLRRAATGAPWSTRLLYGSDYPIPAMMPLYSVGRLAAQGFVDEHWVQPLRELRRHNAWLFDLVLKRRLRWQGAAFADSVFATRSRLPSPRP